MEMSRARVSAQHPGSVLTPFMELSLFARLSCSLSSQSYVLLQLPHLGHACDGIIHGAQEMVMAAATILVVDDDSVIRDVVKTLLEHHGYIVHLAADGEAALALLGTRPFDIVLIDILMPRKEGLETIIEIKRRFPKMLVFAMSASGARKGHDFLQIAAKFGADGIIQKPFTPEQLLALIASRSQASAAPISSLGNLNSQGRQYGRGGAQ
jgi:CheY-like chemotaxis protein